MSPRIRPSIGAHIGFVLLTSFSWLIGGGDAVAMPVTYRAEGAITIVQESLGGSVPLPMGVEVGAPILAVWTFDLNPGEERSRYPQTLGFEITLGSITLSTSTYDIEVENDSLVSVGFDIVGPIDVYSVRACSGSAPACSVAPNLSWAALLTLRDDTGALLDDRLLDASPDRLNQLFMRTLSVSFTSTTGPGLTSVVGQLGPITAIPEPSTAILLGLGLLGLSRARDRNALQKVPIERARRILP